MNKRLQQHTGSEVSDPLTAEGSAQDPVADWASELRDAVVSDIAPDQVTALSELAASATVASAASLATAGGAATGAMTGGHSVTSFIATATGKFIAGAALVASVGTGSAAVAGMLPDQLQNGAADLVDRIGIELPRATQTLEIDSAGRIAVEVVDGVLDVVDIDTTAGWDARVLSETDTEAVVEFVSDTATKTVTMATDTAGGVTSAVETDATVGFGADAGVDVDPADSGDPEAGVDADGSAGSITRAPVLDGAVDAGVDVEVEGDLGIDLGS